MTDRWSSPHEIHDRIGKCWSLPTLKRNLLLQSRAGVLERKEVPAHHYGQTPSFVYRLAQTDAPLQPGIILELERLEQ